MRQVIIIGGGIAGLTAGIRLAAEGLDVALVEKKSYPYHKVCGEYVSNEVLPYLKSLGLSPEEMGPALIGRLQLSSPTGKVMNLNLDLGGFGLSRYALDHYLYKQALMRGVHFYLEKQVNEVQYLAKEDRFSLKLSDGQQLQASIVVGAYGKRAKLDRQLNRPFFQQKSPYIGVKYHIKADFPGDMIALHNFKNGYCGVNKIEEDKICLCYLSSRANLKEQGSIEALEKNVLYKNPHLRELFENSTMLYDKPEVINEISFASKEAVKDHILMAGDAAGMIAPLCGNGMAMAIHSSKILSEEVLSYFRAHHSRPQLEAQYSRRWKKLFGRRLWTGRQIQHLFGREIVSEVAISLCRNMPPLSKWIVRQTHGQPF